MPLRTLLKPGTGGNPRSKAFLHLFRMGGGSLTRRCKYRPPTPRFLCIDPQGIFTCPCRARYAGQVCLGEAGNSYCPPYGPPLQTWARTFPQEAIRRLDEACQNSSSFRSRKSRSFERKVGLPKEKTYNGKVKKGSTAIKWH